MANQLKQRKNAKGQTVVQQTSGVKGDSQSSEVESNLYIAISFMLTVALLVGAFVYYKMEQGNKNPFASFIDGLMPKNRYQK